MKLRQKLTNFLNKEKNNYKENKKLYIVDTSIYMILTLFFFSLPSFSYNSLHLIPVFLMAFLCALIFVRTIIFKKVFIDSIVVSIFGFIFTILISYIVNKLTTPMKMNTTLFFLPLMYLVLYHFFFPKNKTILNPRIIKTIRINPFDPVVNPNKRYSNRNGKK